MPEATAFRCPFEVQGERDNTILNVPLAGTRTERLRVMHDAINAFQTNRKWIAIRFVLPRTILSGCTSLEQLNDRILPYQIEYLASDIDCRLFPYLPYQPFWKRFRERFKRATRYRRYAVRALMTALYTGESGIPRDLPDLCNKLQGMVQEAIALGDKDPVFIFGSLRKEGEKFWLFKMDRGAFAIYMDQTKTKDPELNDALFSIVRAPLYPKAFGRFSEDCELVITRDVDAARLPDTVRLRIRRDANEVHMRHGVRIENKVFSQQPPGLWIPK